MKQIIRELKRQAAGEKLEPEQLKGLIRAGYVYRNGDEYLLTDMGRDALARPGVYPGADAPPAPGSNARDRRWPGRTPRFIWGGSLTPPCTDRCRHRRRPWAGGLLVVSHCFRHSA
jgi:hypothetical protein